MHEMYNDEEYVKETIIKLCPINITLEGNILIEKIKFLNKTL